MSRQDVSDELLTLLGAGHETTASSLGWAFERLRRHPDVLAELVKEVDEGGSDFRQATILELQRARTVIDFAGRHVKAPKFDLGEWEIPHGYTILVSIADLHENADIFPNPERFDPYRFVDTKPPTFAWLPFGGGTRRCIGAAFANTEMDVVLRTVLRHFRSRPTTPRTRRSTTGASPIRQGRRPRGGAPPQVVSAVVSNLVDMMNGAMEYTIPPAHKMGIKVVEARRGHAVASVPLEGNGNHFGVVYAGVQFTVAEMLGGIIALATFDAAKYYPLVKNVDIKFTGMARTDLRAEASLDEDEIARIEAEAAEKGKADFILDAVVKDEAGQTVSVTRGLYQLRAHGRLGSPACAWALRRPLRQLPVRPREVAGVAPRQALEVVLVLGLGLPEVARGRDFRDDLARPQPRGLDVGDGVQRDALLLVVGVEDRRAVAGADVVALPVLRRRVVDLEEELQQRPVVGLRGVVDDLDRLGVPGMVAVGGVGVLAAGVADPGRDHAGLLADQVLHAPEAAARQDRLLVVAHACAS